MSQTVTPSLYCWLQAVGRIERAFAIDGWPETILRAADRFASIAADKSLVVAHLGAATMYRLVEREGGRALRPATAGPPMVAGVHHRDGPPSAANALG